MKLYNFTVDAELLRELGASLVGRPHIALAEVIKNSYDADATRVEIDFSEEAITVVDNGHGMSEHDFAKRWMRVGTTHKREERTSPWLRRTLTGSKGVGRLAVQLLADVVQLTSVGLKDPRHQATSGLHREIEATVEWNKAIAEGDLTDVQVPVFNSAPKMTFAGGSAHGTRVRLSELTEIWDETKFQELAEEIWSLQPPFEVDDERKFEIVLTSDSEAISDAFNEQMQAIFDIWNAKVWGRLLPLGEEPRVPVAMTLPSSLPPSRDLEDDELDRLVDDGETESATDPAVNVMDTRVEKLREALPDRYFQATVKLRGETARTVVWLIEHADIDEVEFEIRVFDLVHRQPKKLRVSEARKYLTRFGGVSIYDNGFRLPYYGASQDWLRMERDHAARLTTSKLVPEGLKITRGLLDLPSNKRVFGWVSVSTTHEALTRAELGISEVPGLAIQVSRDRLAENDAYERLRVMIRATMDLYAMEKARARVLPILPPPEPFEPPQRISEKFIELKSTLQDARPEIPQRVYATLERAVELAVETAEKTEDVSRAYASILGALATAGMTSLAYEHEMAKQVEEIVQLAKRLADIDLATASAREAVAATVDKMEQWAARASRIRQVFVPLVHRETRETQRRLKAKRTIDQIVSYVEALADGAQVDTTGVPPGLLLPRAALPAWSSVFQNLLVNAYNALLGYPDPLVEVTGGGDNSNGWVQVADNGAGVELATSRELWKPFERRLALPREREEAGLGGMGLGLTIVQMIADEINVTVRFVEPPKGMKTAVLINWRGHQ